MSNRIQSPAIKKEWNQFSWVMLGLACLSAILLLSGCEKQASPAFERPPAPVSVAAAITKDVPIYLDAVGKTVARESVTIRPQVSGRIMKIHFNDGSDVKPGALLFTIDHLEDMEEERRLFYVAMTRAKEGLVMSWAQRRGISGNRVSGRPSRFLDEIPAWFKVHHISERFGIVSSDTVRTRSEEKTKGEFQEGNVVRHEKFGLGTVLNVEGVPNDWKLTIRFPEGIKKIMTRYAQLTIER